MPSPTFPDASIAEPLLILTSLSSSLAFSIGSSIRTHFLESYPESQNLGGPGIVIQIRLFSGHILFSCAVGDYGSVGPGNWNWVEGKFNTVRKSGKSSWSMGRMLAEKGKNPADVGFPFPEFACAGGGIPIWIKGNDAGPIGAIIVSGLPQQEDHQLIMNAMFSRMKDVLEPPSDPRYITI